MILKNKTMGSAKAEKYQIKIKKQSKLVLLWDTLRVEINQ